MKKITIMALHLGYGGVEKAISDFANTISEDYDVEIVSTYKLYDAPINKLNNNIRIKYLIKDLKPNREEFMDALKHFKIFTVFKEGIKGIKTLYLKKKLMVQYIRNCNSDIIISTRTFHNNILSKYGNNNAIKIGWEHNYHNNNQKYIKNLISSVSKLNYFVVVSNVLYEDYCKLLKNSSCKCVYIPNMVSIDNKETVSKLGNNNLITVSRLSKEKGIFDLIDVIGIVKNEIPNVKLNLIGDGNLFNDINLYIKKNNLSDNVHLLGFMQSEDVYKQYLNSSLYVMTSYTESFGIVLLESFTFGVPAIAFDSASGACELINQDNGYLIPNRDKKLMANTIVNYLKDKNIQNKFSKGTQKNLSRFMPDCVIILWKQLFK